MKTRLKIADIVFEITTVFDCLKNTEDYCTDAPFDVKIELKNEDIEDERIKSIRECEYENIPYPDYPDYMLENTAVYRKIAAVLPNFDAFVFHGSAVAKDNKAYIFTAKSGTGKTTHTDLWLKNIDGSFIINGDKPIIRMIENKPFVYGTPWMGKENSGTNKKVPLFAVCRLERSKENRIEKSSFQELFPFLLGQCYRPTDGALLNKTVKDLTDIMSAVKLYTLYCNKEDEAAFTAYNGLRV